MTNNIIKFPKVGKPRPPAVAIEAPREASAPDARAARRGVLAGVVKALWVATVLVWPLLKWIVSLDVLFQLVRMVYQWDTPGSHVGWTFAMHFTVLSALTYFVSIYKPKGL